MDGSGKYDMEELIGKYLTGEATADERQEVQDWCTLSADNQKYFDHAKLIFDKSRLHEEAYNTDAAWEKVKEKILAGRTRTLWPVFALRIAASLLLISLISYVVYWQWFVSEKADYLAENEVAIHVLADQTEVSLNRNSTAHVEFSPRKKSGTIRLTGEATIEISPEKKVSWLVQADEVYIRDIGTTFNVRAYPDDPVIEVSVIEGEVQFYTALNEGLFLKAGEKGTYNRASKTFMTTRADTNVISYKTRMFSFDNTNLKSVIELVSAVYNKKIVLPPELENCSLTVDFNNEEFEILMEVIAETLNLQITYTENEVLIEGKGCR